MEEQGNSFLKNQLDSFATSKAEEVTDPLWNFQNDLLERLMKSYRDNENLFSISIYDVHGNMIAEEKDICHVPFSVVMSTERTLTRKSGEDIFELGRLVVRYHDGRIRSDLLNRRESDIIFTIALMVILAGVTWLSIHLLVGRPLRRIKESLHENANNNERTPLVWDSNDELGEVVHAYNNLLHEVEQQTSELVHMNQSMRIEIDNRLMAELELSKIHNKLEQQVNMRTLELNIANQELRELDRQRAAFLSSASHELRTPMTAVLGFATLIKKTFEKVFIPMAQDQVSYEKGQLILNNLDIIKTEGDRLTRLIDDLLDLNKIETGHMEWRDKKMDVIQELHRSANTLASSFDENPALELKVRTDMDIPHISCDPDRFQQVIINLLSNAIKHTSKGVIRIKAEVDNGIIRIQISDTGNGIPEGDMPFIFQKLFQGGGTTTHKPEGTGLGLPISKQIVEHYGGELKVESKEGTGSTFTVELPADRTVPKMF